MIHTLWIMIYQFCRHQKQFPVSPPPPRRKGDIILPTSSHSICHVHHTQCNKTYNGGNPVKMMSEVVWIIVQVSGRSIVINGETPGWSRQNTGIRRRYGIIGSMQMMSFYIVGRSAIALWLHCMLRTSFSTSSHVYSCSHCCSIHSKIIHVIRGHRLFF